jgi:hypothetical protein
MVSSDGHKYVNCLICGVQGGRIKGHAHQALCVPIFPQLMHLQQHAVDGSARDSKALQLQQEIHFIAKCDST